LSAKSSGPAGPAVILSILNEGGIFAFNQVDTMALGHHAIQAAFKPSLKIVLSSDQPDIPMIFGGFYDTNKAQDFAADNVGITPPRPEESYSHPVRVHRPLSPFPATSHHRFFPRDILKSLH
jgi:hypothetical protein